MCCARKGCNLMNNLVHRLFVCTLCHKPAYTGGECHHCGGQLRPWDEWDECQDWREAVRTLADEIRTLRNYVQELRR